MTENHVPDADHILRYVRGQHIDRDPRSGKKVITGGGFIARPRDNNKPSYNWIECFDGNINEQVQQIRALARIGYAASARLAQLNVGKVRLHIARNTKDAREIEVHLLPLEKEGAHERDPSHAEMTNVPDENDPEGEMIGDLIAQCIMGDFPARS